MDHLAVVFGGRGLLRFGFLITAGANVGYDVQYLLRRGLLIASNELNHLFFMHLPEFGFGLFFIF